MTRRLAVVCLSLSVLAVLSAIVMLVAAIWSGDDGAAAIAFVALPPGVAIGGFGIILWAES